jgi:hypothetical protein
MDTASNISVIYTDVPSKLNSKHYTLLKIPTTDSALVANGTFLSLYKTQISIKGRDCVFRHLCLLFNKFSIDFKTKPLRRLP